ncbi:unnamed protein product, partial [Ixodes pacificus]
MQVREGHTSSIRSNDVCLVLLPCPRSQLVVLCTVFKLLKKLLMLCGDVESNPGPITLEDVMIKLNAMGSELKEIKTNQQTTSIRLDNIEASLKELGMMQKKLDTCVAKVQALETSLNDLKIKYDDLENRSRRNNLIIYGIEESGRNDSSTLEARVTKEIIEDRLQLQPVPIERIHRIGKFSPEKPRPVILKLLDFRDKMKILRNCQKLKGSKFSINEDFSKNVQELRKKLLERTKQNKTSGDKVTLRFDKVKINDQMYAWDENKN